VPRSRLTGTGVVMVAYPISEGRVPLLHGKCESPSRDGYPLSPDGYPYCEGGLSILRGTAIPFSKAVGPCLKDMYPVPRDSLSPLARDCGSPFQRDCHQIRTLLHPFSDGRGGAFADGRDPLSE